MHLPSNFIYLAAAVFFAALTHGAAGFGAALVAMPLFAFVLDFKSAAPLAALLTLVINALALLRYRHSFRFRGVALLLAGALAGVPAGVLLLRAADPKVLENLLGGALLLWSLYMLSGPPPPKGISRRGSFLLGLAAGSLGGAINTGGPPVVVYVSSQPWTKEEVHSSLQFVFLVSGTAVVIAHAGAGLTTTATLGAALALLPFLAAGLAAGLAVHGRLSPAVYRRLVYGLMGFLGTGLLAA